MFKKKANYQIISKRNEKSFKKENGDSNKLYQKKIGKLKVNLSSSLKFITKKKNLKKDKIIIDKEYLMKKGIILNTLKKYNSKPITQNMMIISNLINCKPNHFLAIFKDYLIHDYIEEFLARSYFLEESIERIPKLFSYYKNYLHFFCKPTFSDSYSNFIIKNYADLHAENFYKNNIEKKNKENNKLIDIDIDNGNDDIYGKDFNNKNEEELIETIFTNSVKNSIDKINNNEIKKLSHNDLLEDMKQESTIHFDKNNKLSECNTLLFMIKEMQNYKNKKMKERTVNLKKNIRKNKNFAFESYKPLIPNNKTFNRKKIAYNSNSNKLKINTFSNLDFRNVDSNKNLLNNDKQKKLEKYKTKKNLISKNDKMLNRKNTNINKNNHNTTFANINHNKNGFLINKNNYKSPKNISNKKIFPLSPLILNILTDRDCSKRKEPLSSRVNKDKTEKNNYIKIIKRKNNKDNLKLLTTTNRNKRVFDFQKIKSLDSLDTNELNNKQNKSYNKEILNYNNKKKTYKIKKIKYRNINNDYSINKANMDLITRYSTINKTINPAKSNVGLVKTKYMNSMKNMIKVNEIKNKKSVFQKNLYRGIISPLHKNTIDKRYFSFKKLNHININININ